MRSDDMGLLFLRLLPLRWPTCCLRFAACAGFGGVRSPPSWRVRRNLVPHALHSVGLPGGPFLHCGESTAPQCPHGPRRSVDVRVGSGCTDDVVVMMGDAGVVGTDTRR